MRHCEIFQNDFFLSVPAQYNQTFDVISKLSCVALKRWSRFKNLALYPHLSGLSSTWPLCQIRHLFFLQILNAPTKLLNNIFRRVCIAFGALPRKIDMMSPKSKKWVPKIRKKWVQVFRFSSCCFPFIPLVSTLGQSGPSIFWIMLKSNEKHDACNFFAQSLELVRLAGTQPSSLKIDLKGLICVFRTLYK